MLYIVEIFQCHALSRTLWCGKSRHFAGMQDDALMYRLNGLMKNEKVKKPEQI